ncbi:MutS-related protein [Mucilaginibacter lacusdianchii]|uniref:MutS-related protein n=1 Tax=Mucilaginibacter lacusdianchii TaxID=2684211 RepID=UPI00131A706C|nr:DNA mismatch repair protein [Mucilaginibacter sp. JXJ CY 39]
MAFIIDNQTLTDLAVADRNTDSVMGLFKPVTFGGKQLLTDWFNMPLQEASLINDRITIIRDIHQSMYEFPFSKDDLDFIEHYLRQENYTKSTTVLHTVQSYLRHLYRPPHEHYILARGVKLVLHTIHVLQQDLAKASAMHSSDIFLRYRLFISDTINHPSFAAVKPLLSRKTLTYSELLQCDYLFHYQEKEKIKTMLNLIYQLDIFCAAAHTAEQLGFCYPEIDFKTDSSLEVRGLFHPLIKNPVKNDVDFGDGINMCFLTGANMAGKSTFIKSTAICVLLAHMGFPVPATYMRTNIFNGLITTINLADNLSQGYSHFYSEVLRVKQVAQKIKESEKLVVVFDELFRGTNVKDAFDSSVAIIKAFSKIKKCVFIISTHITEVAHELKDCENISFKCIRTQLQNGTPQYTYKLEDGVTDERLGYWIVQNENIVELIEKGLK